MFNKLTRIQLNTLPVSHFSNKLVPGMVLGWTFLCSLLLGLSLNFSINKNQTQDSHVKQSCMFKFKYFFLKHECLEHTEFKINSKKK